MKKICVCGKLKETKTIFDAMNESVELVAPNYKNMGSQVAVINVINKKIGKMPLKCAAVVVNTDIYPNFFCDRPIISVGFNKNAAITFSSVNDGKIVICVCRDICTLSGKCICQQEFCLNTDIKNIDLLITAVAAALMCDIEIMNRNLFVGEN